jgi:hypothetical protein
MDQIFSRLLETNFSELPGLKADASIPVPESIVNELIGIQLAGQKNITSCQISIGEQNRVDVHLKSPLVPWSLDLKLKLFHAVDLTHSPKLRAFLENNVLISKIASSLHAFPDGISMYGDQIIVDLGTFLNSVEQKRLLELIKSVEIRTEKNRLILDVKIEK